MANAYCRLLIGEYRIRSRCIVRMRLQALPAKVKWERAGPQMMAQRVGSCRQASRTGASPSKDVS
jgi:hypothetical protein